MAAMEAANAHQQHQHHHQHQQHGNHQPYPSLPASPTLTNPDMILPDYPDYGRSDSPDTDLAHRENSALTMWKNSHAAAAAVAAGDMHQLLSATPGHGNQSLQSLDHPYGPTGPITPTTPIIYGNGTMLSDIGEVTEVESTPGKPSPSRNRLLARRLESPTRNGSSDAALRSSPTMGVSAVLQQKSKQSLLSQRTRRASLESTSTVTTQDQAALFADFDDSVSVGDSVFQGDDEESLASSYVEGTSGREPTSTRLGIPSSDNLDRLSTYSTTSLSRRAEEILANAKRRLTVRLKTADSPGCQAQRASTNSKQTMEGNLTRARTSLHVSSPAYGSDESTPSPPFQRASTAMYSRETGLPSPISPGHSRISSDIAMRNGLPYRISTPRAQSALGVAGGYRQPLSLSKSADHIRNEGGDENTRPIYDLSSPTDPGMQSLTAEEHALLEEPDSPTNSAKLSQFLSPTFGGFQDENTHGSGRGLQRSASAAQMRDIKDQMKDLKGKISSLREQARTDSIKRRSLQSLRTPSPFTHSQIDQWYAEPKSKRSSEITTTSGPPSRSPWDGEEESVDGKIAPDNLDDDAADEFFIANERREEGQRMLDVRTPERSARMLGADGLREDDDNSDIITEASDEEDTTENYENALDAGYESESGDSLYHDTVQHPISHEDREDAFDYEHFFLHSAMGSMSQRLARRGSTDSCLSEDSIETTRGPVQSHGLNGSSGSVKADARSRRNSTASVSTIETFATAEEGRSRKSMEANGEADAREAMPADFPIHGRSSPGIYRPEGNTKQKNAFFGADTVRTDASSSSLISSANISTSVRDSDVSTYSTIPEEGSDYQTSDSIYRIPVTRRTISGSASNSLHRPSVSSFDSTGTNRSFPLVNKARRATSTGILTPNSSSPEQELKSISNTLLNETASVFEQQQQHSEFIQDNGRLHHHGASESVEMERPSGLRDNPNAPLALQTLMREDKYLVERLVASLGRCVLGLTENGRASTESRMYRRRIEAARRILEGIEGGES